jgi:crotonobetainyl-CoA:carnitine CoA-transferase CaiB-like acyl-CoA transferase
MMDERKIVGFTVNEEYAKWAYQETHPDRIPHKPEALDDIVVLDASYGSYAGLFASSILAEMGAEVIRIEPPQGDLARKMSPYGIMIKDSGLPYITEARNKFHITLDITKAEGKELFKGLARQGDVLVETFKPGHLDALGLGYRQLSERNPGLIYCSINSYGHFGADAETHENQPDYDIIGQARGVIMSVTGESDLDPEVPETYKRPLRHGNWMGWYAGGAWAAFGINAAMFYKRNTGKGQFIDSSPPEGLMAMSNYVMQYFHMAGKQMPRAGNYDYAVFPYTYEKCKDGYTFIGAYADSSWAGLCEIMDRPDLAERFATAKERLTPENQPAIQHEIEKFTVEYTSDELLKMTTEYNRRPDRKGVVVIGRLEKPRDVLRRDHWKERKTFVTLNDPYYGEVCVQNSSFKAMSRTPGRVKWICRPIGADNEIVYRKYLGLGRERLKELSKIGVV